MSIWFAGVILIGLPVMVALLRAPPFTWMDLIPVGKLAAGGALTLGGFLPEARIALRKLTEITESTRDGVDVRHLPEHRSVNGLLRNGVEYDAQSFKTVNSIAMGGGAKTAWCKDTEGNIMAIVQSV